MPDLYSTLEAYDLEMLTIIANRWDVDLNTHDPHTAAELLTEVMLDSERAAYEWSLLSDDERGALQLVLAAPGHQMPQAMYSRLRGEIRVMGPELRTKEKPHLSPLGIAEILYYRGLIATSYGKAAAGMAPVVYVPSDLAAVLPSHATGYDLSSDEEEFDDEEELQAPAETQLTQAASTALVDDLTTLLAYLQLENVTREGKMLPSYHNQSLEGFMLGGGSSPRLALMVALLAGLGLAADNEEGHFKPIPANARKWLDQPRTAQVQSIAQNWQTNAIFNELAWVAGLSLETVNWPNDPLLLKKTIETFLESFSEETWFSVGEFISTVKENEPDFQRPAGNYESWYIRDAETDEYLLGFESWDLVEGGALAFTLTQVMPWLGLIDLGESEFGPMARLTAYGRAFVGVAEWPKRTDPETPLKVNEEGQIQASRNLSRYDRFQLARFTDWGLAGEPYEYVLSIESLQRARKQGIKGEHILTFLKRETNNQIPAPLTARLETWSKSDDTLEPMLLSRLVVLQTTSDAELETIWGTPELRRYLAARLGPRAVTVRADQWEGLSRTLLELGFQVQVEF
jgi:hypothetical protein